MNSSSKMFKDKLIESYLEKFTKDNIPDFETKWHRMKMWRKSCIEGNLERTKETAIQGAFMLQVFECVLGYTTQTSTEDDMYYQTQEYKNVLDTSEADGAIGFFSKRSNEKDVRAVIELKDARKDLDKKQNRSSHLTPVEQAFMYANKNGSNCAWVIVSNFVETRLYKSNSSLAYEVFDIRKMDNEEEFVRFYFFLCKDHLLSESKSFIDSLYQKNEEIGTDITNDFYKTYKLIRNNLYACMKELNPKKDELVLFEKTQKIMDRFTFIFFCENCGLLPENVYKKLVESVHNSFSFTSNKLWTELKGLFASIDRGRPEMKINRYNGGLFKADSELDELIISDGVLEAFLELAVYDFGSDLNVNILGQIFEQSIADVEQIKYEISGQKEDSKGKRKEDGIFYTPYYVTRYIVEQTVGVYLQTQKEEIKRKIFKEGSFKAIVVKPSTGKKNTIEISSWVELPNEEDNMLEEVLMYRKAVIQLHLKFWTEYESVLKNIKICDPSCGSGAFLNQCFDYLHEEMNFVLDMKYAYDGQISLFDIDKEILQNNLYGVDINPESVEITKLSLWLKTAKQNQTLASLDDNIKCGNSIINDKKVVENAFEWKEEFPEVFANGGFDIIIGNPPYGAKLDQTQKQYLADHYLTTEYNFDTYKTFFELGFSILNENGYLGYITPNTFFTLELGANKLRKFLFDNNILCKIVEIYNVFPAAVVEPVITVFKKTKPTNELFSSICIPRNTRLTSTFLNEGVTSEFSQSDLRKDEQYIFNYRSSKEDQMICECMKKNVRLDTLFGVMTGAKPYQVGKGTPPQTKQVQDTKPFTGFEKIDENWIPYMRGRVIDRYTNKWKASGEYIKYGEWLAEPRSPEVFAGRKLFVRQTGDCLVATYDEGNVSNNTLHVIYPLESNASISLFYLLGLLNSKLINWYYQIVNYLELGKPMAEVKGIYIKKIPVAVGTETQREEIEDRVARLLELAQRKFDAKFSCVKYICRMYEPQRVTEKMIEIDSLSFKEFIEELKKQKVKMSGTQQLELLNIYEEVTQYVNDVDKEIKKLQGEIDELVMKIYEIPENVQNRIFSDILS